VVDGVALGTSASADVLFVVGAVLGCTEDGTAVVTIEAIGVGRSEGCSDGTSEGRIEGDTVGWVLGLSGGDNVGSTEGAALGTLDGVPLGVQEGSGVDSGIDVGTEVMPIAAVGEAVGLGHPPGTVLSITGTSCTFASSRKKRTEER
jgi:hypothetical protein